MKSQNVYLEEIILLSGDYSVVSLGDVGLGTRRGLPVTHVYGPAVHQVLLPSTVSVHEHQQEAAVHGSFGRVRPLRDPRLAWHSHVPGPHTQPVSRPGIALKPGPARDGRRSGAGVLGRVATRRPGPEPWRAGAGAVGLQAGSGAAGRSSCCSAAPRSRSPLLLSAPLRSAPLLSALSLCLASASRCAWVHSH